MQDYTDNRDTLKEEIELCRISVSVNIEIVLGGIFDIEIVLK